MADSVNLTYELHIKRRYYWLLKLWMRALILLAKLKVISPHRAIVGTYWLLERWRSRMIIVK